jgi:hypothetical protein
MNEPRILSPDRNVDLARLLTLDVDPGLASRRTSGGPSSPDITRSGTMPRRVRSFPSRCISSSGLRRCARKTKETEAVASQNVID